LVSELGPNAFGEPIDPGRVDCYLGLPLPAEDEAAVVGCWVVAPRWLLHPAVPQPAGSLVYELVTGHPDRHPSELVLPADLTVELRAWPADSWAAPGVDLDQVAGCGGRLLAAGHFHGWMATRGRRGPVSACAPRDDVGTRRLRARLGRLVARARRRWLHPSSGRRSAERFL
jgi:hypothetical protein